tara:strand:+ start:379 stop:585 length:207 start_codon:yes stop_codon:yes gene_type:complete
MLEQSKTDAQRLTGWILAIIHAQDLVFSHSIGLQQPTTRLAGTNIDIKGIRQSCANLFDRSYKINLAA